MKSIPCPAHRIDRDEERRGILMSRFLIGLVLLAGMAMSGNAAVAAEAGSAASERFKALYEREWDWRQTQFPGADDEDSQEKIADRLPKVDPATQAERTRYWQDVLQQLDAIPVSALPEQEQVDYQVYRNQIEVLLDRQR